MKKTLQSKLTAALFAAAISTGAGGTLTPQFANAFGSDTDITTVPQTTYGPPGWMTTTEDTEETTTELMKEGTIVTYEETTTTSTSEELCLKGTVTTVEETTTEPEPIQLAGEATIPTTTVTTDNLVTSGVVPIYAEAGDSDYNGSIDARDLTMLKQYLLNQNYARTLGGGPDPYDVNGDGAIDKNDVKALIRLLTGKPEEDDKITETTTTVTVTSTDTSTTTFTTYPVCLYGPPKAFD